MWVIVAPFVGGFLGSALAGCLAGFVVAALQLDTYPPDDEQARELRRLMERLRRPWRARLARWMRHE
ncbi:MAG TPA: hypothetical protein VGD94_23545 [Vicinamibacterales bacterium]